MERAELTALVRASGCAEEHAGFIFLCDPHWGKAERAQFERLREQAPVDGASRERGWLCVPTGGTSGALKFARHDEETLTAAVRGFCAHFGLRRVNAIDVLPAHHVSGLMARVRCAATGGQHVAWAWKDLESGVRAELPDTEDGWVLSLVPTQLQRLLASGDATVAWLRRLKIIFLGGGPAWPELLNAARAARLRLAPGYGMSETAAMIAALRPEEFAAGAEGVGKVLPHAKVEIVEERTGEKAGAGETGLVRVRAESLFRGYFPGERTADFLVTEDLGAMTAESVLSILGRRDAVIITGGKKVFPAEIEAALRASGEFEDVVVMGAPDAEWGECVTAFYPQCEKTIDGRRVEAALSELAAYKRPKKFVAVAGWPRNAQGKVNRAALREMARENVGEG